MVKRKKKQSISPPPSPQPQPQMSRKPSNDEQRLFEMFPGIDTEVVKDVNFLLKPFDI